MRIHRNDLSKWDLRGLELAETISHWSKDPSTKTGAVILGPNDKVVSTGFNGFPQRMPDTSELLQNRDEKYSRIIHAEMNALLFAHLPLERSCTLFTYPFMCCDRCVVHMIQAGIYRFVAPKCPADKEERWGELFNKTRKYVNECNGVLLEVE